MDIARTLRFGFRDVNPEAFLAEEIKIANHIRNHLITTSCFALITPFEVVHWNKPNVSHFRRFGGTAFGHVPKQKREGKFQYRSKEGLLVGYGAGNSPFIYLKDSKNVIIYQDVKIQEDNSSTNV